MFPSMLLQNSCDCYLFVLLCTVDICSLLYARTTIMVWRLLLLQINIICILQKTKNFFRECSTLGISVYTVWESCRSSATSDLWLKPESWSLNFKFLKKIIQWFKIQWVAMLSYAENFTAFPERLIFCSRHLFWNCIEFTAKFSLVTKASNFSFENASKTSAVLISWC